MNQNHMISGIKHKNKEACIICILHFSPQNLVPFIHPFPQRLSFFWRTAPTKPSPQQNQHQHQPADNCRHQVRISQQFLRRVAPAALGV